MTIHNVVPRELGPTKTAPVRGAATAQTAAERCTYSLLLGLAITGMLSPHDYNFAHAQTLLEAALPITAVLSLRRDLSRTQVVLLLVPAVYVATKAFLMVGYRPAPTADFVQAYKAYIYLVPLALLVRRSVFDGHRLARVTDLLLIAFALKYGYSRLLHIDPLQGTRPGLYDENNFELVLLLGFVYLAFPFYGARPNVRLLAAGAVVGLSGSRSGAGAFFLLYLFVVLRPRARTFLLHLVGSAVVAYGVFQIFAARLAGDAGQQVDRLHFLKVFVNETAGWSIWQWMFGSFPLTPLSTTGCASLSSYSALFSHSAGTPSVCYSVILHAFVLRALFDQGIVGFGLLYTVLWIGLRQSGASRRDGLAILGIVSANALSVSAFNSVFVAILLAVAFGLRRDPASVPLSLKERVPGFADRTVQQPAASPRNSLSSRA